MADMSNTSVDTDKNKIKPNYEWAGRPVTNSDYLNQILQMKKGRNYDFAGKKIWMMLNIEIWMKEHFG